MSGWPTDDPRLRELVLTDATVCATYHKHLSMVDALLAVVGEKQRLLGELTDLQSRIGHRYKLPSGQILVHRPPDDVLPLVDLSCCFGFTEPAGLDSITLMGVTYRREQR